MKSKYLRVVLYTSCAPVIALTCAGHGYAQTTGTAPQAQNVSTDSAQDEIIVTGTSIRGAAPVGSTLVQLGRDEIDSSTSVTTDQIVKEIPQVFNFGVTDTSRSQSGGSSNITLSNSINIRGVAPYSTLSLINGRRAIPQGTVAATVDPTNIPAIALERIEIIADGASAVYGSDAVTGVANLILRRRYDGIGTDVQYGVGDNYHTFTAAAIAGTSWSSGRFTLSGQHSYRSAVNGRDRDFYSADLTSRGGSDYRSTLCSSGNEVVNGVTYPIPAGGATSANLVAGAANKCDNYKNNDIVPQQEINSGTLTFDQQITDRVKLFVDGLYAKRNGLKHNSVAQSSLTVPSTNPYYVAPAGVTPPLCNAANPTGPRCVVVQYSFSDDYSAANAYNKVSSTVWQLTGGLDVDLGSGWNATAYTTYGQDYDQSLSIGSSINSSRLTAALSSTDPATAFNPFGTSANSASVIADIFNNLVDTDGKTWGSYSGLKVDGSLFHLPGGDVRVAVGGEFDWQKERRSARIAGVAAGTTQISRNVRSAYGELLIPIFGAENARPGFHSLDINIAGRVDKYSDVGTTTNPKIGINWQPVDDIRLHGSYGTSFRAPLLSQLISNTGVPLTLLVQTYYDPTANGGAGGNIRAVTLNGVGQSLKPETARTWSFGIDYSPSARPGAQISINYFDLVYEGQIASYSSNLNVLQQENLYSSIITRGSAAQALIAQYLASGAPLRQGTTTEALASTVLVDGRSTNLGTTITRGIDFSLVFPWRIESLGTFRFALNGTRFFTFKVAYTPNGALIERLGTYGNPTKLRARGSLGWTSGDWAANLFVNYQDSYWNDLVTPAQKVDSYTTVDLSLGYNIGSLLSIAKEVRLGLDVTNLFDRDPPFVNVAPSDNGGGGYDSNVASAVGRVVALSLRTHF